jgi:hypothetical protein
VGTRLRGSGRANPRISPDDGLWFRFCAERLIQQAQREDELSDPLDRVSDNTLGADGREVQVEISQQKTLVAVGAECPMSKAFGGRPRLFSVSCPDVASVIQVRKVPSSGVHSGPPFGGAVPSRLEGTPRLVGKLRGAHRLQQILCRCETLEDSLAIGPQSHIVVQP